MGNDRPSEQRKVELQRDRGAFYTPLDLAEYVAREALSNLAPITDSIPNVVDPACGDGVLLAAALRQLAKTRGIATSDAESRLLLAQQHLFGVDRCPQAISAAQRTLAYECAAGGREKHAVSDETIARFADSLRGNFQLGDALLDDVFDPDALESDSFPSADVVLANPPFVNIRRLSKTYSAIAKEKLRERYRSATGNFDLYVLFIERAMKLLRPGGLAAFVTPNKLATMRYAQACRAMLRDETTLLSILDASAIKVFSEANVYPFVWVFRTQPPPADHQVSIRCIESENQLAKPVRLASVTQSSLDARGFVLTNDLHVESKVATRELQTWGVVHSGASGFTARRMLGHLVESSAASPNAQPNAMRTTAPGDHDGGEADQGWEFIVSGNIDRYQIALGEVRYMKHRFRRPRLRTSCPLTGIKQSLYSGPKIVLAGMSKRLEAALDEDGLALGVQVYALVAEETQRDYLLGLLNSKLLSYLFRLRFAAKRLADDYLAVNKSQLDQLPIAAGNDARSGELRKRISDRVKSRRDQAQHAEQAERLDWEIDQLVYDLYRLSDQESQTVERAVA